MMWKWKIGFICLFALLIFIIPFLSLGGNLFSLTAVNGSPGSTNQSTNNLHPLDISSDQEDLTSISEENGSIKSDGYFNILDQSTGQVNKVEEREYVIGAVCAEMPPSFHTEALKAQAVAAHTYALRLREQQKISPDEELKGADFSADPSNWKGYVTKEQAKERFGDNFDLYYGKIEEAVDEVLHVGMTYQDFPIVAAYHAISPGATENSENIWTSSCAYLKSVDSEGDIIAPGYESTVTLTQDQVEQKLKEAYPDITLDSNTENWIQVLSQSSTGTVLSASVGDQTLTGSEVRSLFDLRSPCFTVSCADGNFVFQVKGYGHGVGLSQYGADYMARQGSNYAEILTHYYTDIQLVTIEF